MNTTLKAFLVCILLLAVKCISQAQTMESPDPNKFRQQIPTSPEAAALGKFGDIPVGLYTGVPNITIPIYNLKIKDFELPISLSYNSSGIKVEELAPNTGLGWALNAGGTISCSVNGLQDLEVHGFAHPVMAEDTIPAMVLSPSVLNYDFGQNGGGELYMWAKRVADGTVDTQPDLYYYSYPGGSGRFYTDSHNQWHTVPFAAIRVNYNVTTEGFIITDEQGRKFTYGGAESSELGNNCGVPILNSTRLLTKIELPDHNVITFTYDSVNYSYYIQPAASRMNLMPGQQNFQILDCNNHVNNIINYSGSRLAKIASTTGQTIEFKYLNSRTDLPGTKSLDSVIISNQNKVIDRYAFSYSYFGTGPDADQYRLKLNSITNQNGARYLFDYNNSITVPHRLSFAQDHWGYYNGKFSNSSLLPLEQDYGFFTGANREIDTAYSQVAILKKITYPTGGFTQFNYEQNDYYFVGNENTYRDTSYSAYGQDNQTIYKTFTIPAGTNVAIANAHYDDGTGPYATSGGLGDEPVDPGTTITISGDNGTFYSLYNKLTSDGNKALSLSPGNYTIAINCTNAANGAYCTVSFTTKQTTAVAKNKFVGGLRIKSILSKANVSSNEEAKYYVYRQQAHPDRSSGNINFAPVYTSVYYRYAYQHPDPNEPEDPCNRIYSNPLYTSFYRQTASSLLPLGSIKGGSVGYNFVTTVYGSSVENGKTESTFSFSPSNGGSLSYPLVPVVDYDYKNGYLTQEVQYRKVSGTFQPLTNVRTFYSVQPESVFWNSHFSPSTYQSNALFRGRGVAIEYQKDEHLCGLTLYPALFRINEYRIPSEWVRQDSTVASSYYYNAANVLTDSVVTFKHLTYNNPAHLLPNVTTTQASNHNTIQTTTTYPQDYTAGTSVAIDSLVAQHRITTALQSQVNNNSSVITSKTLYRSWGNGIVEPEYVQSQYNSQPVENRLQYYGYDSTANVLSASQYGGPPDSYHWAYNKQYPIAECKNALSDEFYFEGFEESTATGVTTGASHTGNKYINTGSGSYSTSDKLAPGYHSKTYVISYWSKTGSGPWVYSGELPYTGQTLSGQLDDIRIYPKDAQMSTYTYEPMVGITTATDDKGETTYYEYDSFMRLMNVRDKDGKLLKHVDYHYQNQ